MSARYGNSEHKVPMSTRTASTMVRVSLTHASTTQSQHGDQPIDRVIWTPPVSEAWALGLHRPPSVPRLESAMLALAPIRALSSLLEALPLVEPRCRRAKPARHSAGSLPRSTATSLLPEGFGWRGELLEPK